MAEAVRSGAELERMTASVAEEIRRNPAAPSARLALYQLACVDGDWERAKRQLTVAATLSSDLAVTARAFELLVEAEARRRAVLDGREMPACVGEPPAWLAMFGQALALDARGEKTAAADLRGRARDQAEPSAGTADGRPFAWIMDADPRFGPVLEVVVNGAYRWLPFVHLRALRTKPPVDMIDLVWLPADLELAGGGTAHAFLPVRYPGSEASPDPAIRTARLTAWMDAADGWQLGLGQRVLATDTGDLPLLDLRELRIEAGSAGPEVPVG